MRGNDFLSDASVHLLTLRCGKMGKAVGLRPSAMPEHGERKPDRRKKADNA
jgi:hypothetical protein